MRIEIIGRLRIFPPARHYGQYRAILRVADRHRKMPPAGGDVIARHRRHSPGTDFHKIDGVTSAAVNPKFACTGFFSGSVVPSSAMNACRKAMSER